MNLVVSLILGAVAGVLALYAVYRATPGTPWQWIGAVVVGVIGGWVGGLLANILGLEAVNWLGSLVVAFASALVVVLLARKMAPSGRRQAAAGR